MKRDPVYWLFYFIMVVATIAALIVAASSCTPALTDQEQRVIERWNNDPLRQLPHVPPVTFCICVPIWNQKNGVYHAYKNNGAVAYGFAWRHGFVRVFDLWPMTNAEQVVLGDTLRIRNTKGYP